MSDESLRDDVLQALHWDPSIDVAHIGVAAKAGAVVLTGKIPSYADKVGAERVARRVRGVRAIINDIEVHLEHLSDDQALTHRARNLLDWDVGVPRGAVNVAVTKGLVTLTGEVDWEHQRRAAEDAVRRLEGVRGVSNVIALRPQPQGPDIHGRIKAALERLADLEAGDVAVEVFGEKVILSGKVRTLAEHEALTSAVWAAPGVRVVEDHMTVGG